MTARGALPKLRVAHLGHLPLREAVRAGPCLGLVAHDGAHQPEQRTLRREDLHHAQSALDFPVGALLHVVGAQALPVRRREVQVRERVGLRLLEHPCRPRAVPLQHLAHHDMDTESENPEKLNDNRGNVFNILLRRRQWI